MYRGIQMYGVVQMYGGVQMNGVCRCMGLYRCGGHTDNPLTYRQLDISTTYLPTTPGYNISYKILSFFHIGTYC